VSEVYRHLLGDGPLIVSLPHCGTRMPDHLAARMTPAALALADTDWHLDRLYDFATALGAHMLMASFSRYVVDLDRDPSARPPHRDADDTGICPLTTFDRLPVYRAGEEPDKAEINRRIDVYWRPYHERLGDLLERCKAKHACALLFEAHSIHSRVPRFFTGRLPDFSLGSGRGASADPALAARLLAICQEAAGEGAELDGHFTGGYITRHYGRPELGVQAIQLELVKATYMDEAPPFLYRAELAAGLMPTLRRLLEALLDWANAKGG
jgi:N-formylglutamate deformylase